MGELRRPHLKSGPKCRQAQARRPGRESGKKEATQCSQRDPKRNLDSTDTPG